MFTLQVVFMTSLKIVFMTERVTLNFFKTIKAKDAAPGASNSNAASVPPSTAQSTNVSFQSLPKVDLS